MYVCICCVIIHIRMDVHWKNNHVHMHAISLSWHSNIRVWKINIFWFAYTKEMHAAIAKQISYLRNSPHSNSTAKLWNFSNSTAKLRNFSNSTAKLLNFSSSTGKLPNFSSSTGKLRNFSSSTGKLRNFSSSTAKLRNFSNSTAKLRDFFQQHSKTSKLFQPHSLCQLFSKSSPAPNQPIRFRVAWWNWQLACHQQQLAHYARPVVHICAGKQ